MSRRQLLLLAVGVVAAHGVVFWLISGTQTLPKTPYVAPPNFVAKEATWIDKETGEKLTYHEYKVSTKLALPYAMARMKQ